MSDSDRIRLLKLRQAQEVAKAQSAGGGQVMSQVNKGIAQSIGGMVDFINPFDAQTGSAVTGIERGMGALGIETAQGDPQTIGQGFARGAGQAAGALIPAAGVTKGLSAAGGMVGTLAGDAYKSLSSLLGASTEVAAGGMSGAGAQTAKQAGAPEWVQDLAAVAAPMAIPAAVGTAKAASRISPVAMAGRKVAAAVAPYTKTGAKAVATERMQTLAGGPERAAQLAAGITPDNPLGLTPAQQTGDANMLAVQKLAGEQDPELRAYLEQRQAESAGLARSEIEGMGGDVEAAQRFMQDRRRAFTQELQGRADNVMAASGDKLSGFGDGTPESVSGTRVADEVKAELQQQVQVEREKWNAVPKDAPVSTENAKARYNEIEKTIPRAQREDIPGVARRLLSSETNDAFSDSETAGEIHGLYSKLREVARNARAGETPNRNTARIADDLADALLADLEVSAAGDAFGEAVAFTRALHDVYDQGAVSKILKRSRSGVTLTEPEAAAARTVGRGGVEGMVASRQLEDAGASSETIRNYIANQFSGAATNPGTGEVTLAGARRFIAKNSELLERYPELKAEIDTAVTNRETSEQFANRISTRMSALEDAKRSATARFIGGQAETAYKAITDAKNPVSAARRIANEARKDPSGQALAGVKGALASHLINASRRTAGGQTAMDANALTAAMDNPTTRRAMAQIFNEGEMARMAFVARELSKAQARNTANIGEELSGARPNRMVEYLARFMAVQHAPGPGGVRNLQTAQMASSRVKELLGSLTTDKASQMIADAVSDPELFKALLTQTGSAKDLERAIPRFIPYLVGGAAVAAQ